MSGATRERRKKRFKKGFFPRVFAGKILQSSGNRKVFPSLPAATTGDPEIKGEKKFFCTGNFVPFFFFRLSGDSNPFFPPPPTPLGWFRAPSWLLHLFPSPLLRLLRKNAMHAFPKHVNAEKSVKTYCTASEPQYPTAIWQIIIILGFASAPQRGRF